MSQKVVPSTLDEVVADYPLPAGCTLQNVALGMKMIGPDDTLVTSGVMYGVAGYVVPMLDPEGGVAVDTIWDQLVPKDVAEGAGVFDLDTGATDTTPEFNWGEVDWTQVFGVAGNSPVEIFRRRKLITFADVAVGYFRVDSAPDLYVPLDRFQTMINRRVRAAKHSYVLFGFSSPDLTQTSATLPTTINEQEWVMMTYMETFLEYAFVNLMGQVEAGAESPYEEASAFVAELLERTALEESSNAFTPVQWLVFTQATFVVDVPGRLKVGTLNSEG